MPADASSAPPRAIDEIIERRLGGDRAAWNEIVRLYRLTVFNVAYTPREQQGAAPGIGVRG